MTPSLVGAGGGVSWESFEGSQTLLGNEFCSRYVINKSFQRHTASTLPPLKLQLPWHQANHLAAFSVCVALSGVAVSWGGETRVDIFPPDAEICKEINHLFPSSHMEWSPFIFLSERVFCCNYESLHLNTQNHLCPFWLCLSKAKCAKKNTTHTLSVIYCTASVH